MDHTIRAGDSVKHGPSGETWVVACTRPDSGELIPAGWPEGVAQISDCELVEECSDEKHREMLEACAKHKGMRGSWARHQLELLNQREAIAGSTSRAERGEIERDNRSALVFRLPRPLPGATIGIKENGIELELKAIAGDEDDPIAGLQLTYRPTTGEGMTHIADHDAKRITLQLPDKVVIVEIG